MGIVREAPPLGNYLAHEVGRLAGVSGNKIGQWARRGYIRSSQSQRSPRVYAYQDVAEAMVVHGLIDAHVPHLEIRRALQALRAETDSSWPLSGARVSVTVPGIRNRLDADETKHRPVAQLVVYDDGRYIRPAKSLAQGLFDIQLRPVLDDLQRGGWAARDLPSLRFVEVNPERLSGRPTIRGRRVSAEDVAVLALQPGGSEALRDGYDLSGDEIADAVQWWEKVRGYEAAA
jgi:uncharacterized protein (DUF433 family)/DNA-binding transcriptional MerR regulator